jgi:hypothetical protein
MGSQTSPKKAPDLFLIYVHVLDSNAEGWEVIEFTVSFVFEN